MDDTQQTLARLLATIRQERLDRGEALDEPLALLNRWGVPMLPCCPHYNEFDAKRVARRLLHVISPLHCEAEVEDGQPSDYEGSAFYPAICAGRLRYKAVSQLAGDLAAGLATGKLLYVFA